jgi:hypothetical protein
MDRALTDWALMNTRARCDKLPAIDRTPQGLGFFAQVVREAGSALGYVAYTLGYIACPVLGFLGPILQRLLGIFIAAFQVATELLAGLWGEYKGRQSTRSNPNKQECNSGPYMAAVGRFITSRAHDLTSFHFLVSENQLVMRVHHGCYCQF